MVVPAGGGGGNPVKYPMLFCRTNPVANVVSV